VAGALFEACGDGQRPRRQHPCAERREHADPPVAELVSKALHDDALIGRDQAATLGLGPEVAEQVGGRVGVQPTTLGEDRPTFGLVKGVKLAGERAHPQP
jgi:hypothetical protein